MVVAQRTEHCPAKAEVDGSNPSNRMYNKWIMAKRDLKEEKRLKNEEYAKKFRKSFRSRERRSLAELNRCGVRGHDNECTFDTCPKYR